MDDRRISIAELREQQRQHWPLAYRNSQPAVLQLLRAADDFLRLSSEQLQDLSLLPAEFDVLAALQRQPAPHCVTPGALCQALLMSSGGLSKLLKRLESAGLVTRPANPEDGRSQLVQLSEAGGQLANTAMQRLCKLQRQWLTPLDDEQREQLNRLLDSLNRQR